MAEVSTQPKTRSDRQSWTVMVRHSPFLLKTITVDASDKDEAKAKFIEAAKAQHEVRAEKIADQKGLDIKTIQSTQKSIRDSFKLACELDKKDELEWTIRPTAEVKAERAKLDAAREAEARRYQMV